MRVLNHMVTLWLAVGSAVWQWRGYPCIKSGRLRLPRLVIQSGAGTLEQRSCRRRSLAGDVAGYWAWYRDDVARVVAHA